MNKAQKDFLVSIENAIQSGELEKVLNVLKSEIGFLMSKNKLALIRTVQNSGKDISDEIGDEELANIISSGIINRNNVFMTNLIETIFAEKATYSNFIGTIIKFVGSIVKGIGDSISAGIQAKSEKTVAEQNVKTEERKLRTAKTELASGIIDVKKRAEQAKVELEAKRTREIGAKKNLVLLAGVVAGFVVVGSLVYVVYQKNKNA